MTDPFKIDGPTCIKVSGGRTSGLMLRRVLDSNGGLPEGSLAIFNNTGKEREESLEFVNELSVNWGVPIVWLEYLRGPSFKVVSFETANRDGAPFEALIRQRIEEGEGGLPNAVNRYCSSEMKTRTTIRYLRSIGWTEWDTFVGYRADEPLRYVKLRANPHPETKDEFLSAPLATAGVSKHDVAAFWKKQPFDLRLPNVNGQTYEGNCDLCFMKHPNVVRGLIAAKPKSAVWWIKQEDYAKSKGRTTGAVFADDRASIAQMAANVRDQYDFAAHDDYFMLSCTCGD